LRLSVWLIPIWLAVLGIGYYLGKRNGSAGQSRRAPTR
jgi:aromatic amino acid transport protein AroP